MLQALLTGHRGQALHLLKWVISNYMTLSVLKFFRINTNTLDTESVEILALSENLKLYLMRHLKDKRHQDQTTAASQLCPATCAFRDGSRPC